MAKKIKKFFRSNDGITLMEIVIALVILGMLYAISSWGYNSVVKRTQMASIDAAFRSFKMSIESYYSDNNRIPSLSQFNNYSDVQFVQIDTLSGGIVVAESLDHVDPWGNPYRLILDDGAQPKVWFISRGPDEQFAVDYRVSFEDDIAMIIQKNT